MHTFSLVVGILLSWEVLHGSFLVQVERRSRGGDWTVLHVTGLGHYHDATGQPGDCYRVRHVTPQPKVVWSERACVPLDKPGRSWWPWGRS